MRHLESAPSTLANLGFTTIAAGILHVLAAAILIAPAGAAFALPVPANCQFDLRANDYPGQKDITMFCVGSGDSSPYDLFTIANMDETTVTGANTMDTCLLFNTDGDAFANLAVCVTLNSSGSANGNKIKFKELRLFTCKDTRADRCTGSTLVAGPYTSTCEVSQTDDDPFGPAILNGPGGGYPWDTRVLCGIDLDDFGLSVPITRLMDACSYPSAIPNSDPEECVLFQTCTTAASCDDGNGCTIDACDPSGVCMHTADEPVACSDGLFCNGAETCNALGFCGASGDPLTCDDGIACTVDACDEFTDACVNDPRGSLCDDGLFCNGAEACDAAQGCVAGTTANCDDTVPCTVDACDEATDSCLHPASDAACNDGAFCNGVETCDALAGCVQGSAPDCADTVGCTVDSCDESTDACTHVENDAACSNGRFCDGVETCDAAAGCVPGTAPDCNDRVACTDDRCDEEMNSCVNVADNSACDDGLFCNGVETCDAAAGCEPGDEPCVGPATCSEATDACVGCSSDAECDNGVFCDGAETCNGLTGACSPGHPVECNDAVACTVDACDEAAAACTHRPVDAACDNGLFCDGQEDCDAAAGCVTNPVAPCDDEIACTVDTCNETTNSCKHAPSDQLCDNGRYCDGKETCSARYGCEGGEDVTCRPDGSNCSVEKCDESIDACTSDFSNCVCGDRELTRPEECEPPQRAGTFEDCNNLVDDDQDGLVDCEDPGCLRENRPKWICDENCRRDLACAPVADDPALITYRQGHGPDSLWMHGRFALDGEVDPGNEAFTIRISNEKEPVFVATLEAGALKPNGAYFSYVDPDARVLGNASPSGGLAAVRLRLRTVDGVPNLTFRIQAWGDFTGATHRVMSTQVAIGSESGTLTAEWKAKPGKWILRQKAF